MHHDRPSDVPILLEAHDELDIEGNPLVVTDANNLATGTNTYAAGGLQLHTTSPDAGARWALPNALGAPLRAWDSRAHVRRWTFDALQRPTHAFIKHATDAEKLQTRTVYGESLGITAPAPAHRGQVYRVYDSAGLLTALAYDFKANLLAHSRRLAIDDTTTPEWLALATETDPGDIETAAAALLEAETFTTAWTFDALGRVTTQTTPDASVTTQTFGAGGLLQAIAVHIRGALTPTNLVAHIDYNARGQRTLIAYGSDTAYTYDPNSSASAASTPSVRTQSPPCALSRTCATTTTLLETSPASATSPSRASSSPTPTSRPTRPLPTTPPTA